MKKLNVVLGLLLVMLCVMLVSADVVERSEQRFEYASIAVYKENSNLFSINWDTENFHIYSKSMRDFLIQISGESVSIGDITQVKNEVGMLNFLGDRGWELVSSYYEKGRISGSTTTYIFKRLWSK